MPSLLIQRCLQWLGHAHRMEPDCLPREILYGQLREGVRRMSRLLLRHKDVIKRDLRSALIDTSAWGGQRQSPRYMAARCQSGGFKGGTLESRLQARERRGKNAPLRHLQQRLPHQDRATQSYKILPKSPALTIASSIIVKLFFKGKLEVTFSHTEGEKFIKIICVCLITKLIQKFL